MKYISAILVAILAVIGVATATVDMGQSISYGFTGATAGATYSESGEFHLGTEDALTLGSVFSFDNAGNMFGQTTINLDDNFVGTTVSGGNTMIYPGGSEHGATDGGASGQTNNGNGNGGYDNGHHGGPQVVADFTPTAHIYQDLYYIKDFAAPVDPHMHNGIYAVGGNMDITMFMGSKMSGVEMGMTTVVDSGDKFYFQGFTTDADFTPIARAHLNANNFEGTVSIKDKFSFNRYTQLNSAVFMFNSTL